MLGVFIVLTSYVLSLGPALKIYDKGKFSPSQKAFMEHFYLPLEWAYKSTLLHRPIGMYLHLWSERFSSNGEIQ